ncbi:urea active transporter [Haematococcus lacustris]
MAGAGHFFGDDPALPQGLGWFIVVGLGGIFSVLTSGLVWLDQRFSGHSKESSEHFATAGRSINVGLTACDIVSKWTWAATLLQSSNVAFKFGVSGPFWYASGATVQVLLFAVLAVEVKRKAPTVHTVLEIIKARWGMTAHKVFLFFTLATNVIVTAMLILGGAAVINALSGVDIYAAAFLIPVGVSFYTAHGGLRATFLAAWAHVAIIYIALCIFMFMIYGTSPDLGSPGIVYDHLVLMDIKHPVKDNMGGSHLTMFSKSGLVFGIINIIGNFGTVFVDQAYWQSAIAARPSATYKGYILGGLCWFAIPFTMATSIGLAGRALDLPITIAESNAGLTPPAVAVHLMGKGGAFLMVLQLFMAVTASGSAEQIAVSSLFSYDVYREYFNPQATGRQLVLTSRIMVIVYAVLSGVFAIILLKLKLSLGWVYLFMGIIIGSAVFPIASALCWKRCSAVAAITSAVVTMPLAVMTWLVTTQLLHGELTLLTTGEDYPMLAGNLVALFFSAFLCIGLSIIYPQKDFEWSQLLAIPTVEKDSSAVINADDKATLDKVLKWTYWTGGILSVVLFIAWPLLALPAKVFSRGYWTFWVILAIVWGLLASLVCILLPLWEAREGMWAVTK